MHELSLMQGILDSIAPVARDAGAVKVTQVRLTVGEMTQVVEEAMRFAWEALTADEPLYEVSLFAARVALQRKIKRAAEREAAEAAE